MVSVRFGSAVMARCMRSTTAWRGGRGGIGSAWFGSVSDGAAVPAGWGAVWWSPGDVGSGRVRRSWCGFGRLAVVGYATVALVRRSRLASARGARMWYGVGAHGGCGMVRSGLLGFGGLW